VKMDYLNFVIVILFHSEIIYIAGTNARSGAGRVGAFDHPYRMMDTFPGRYRVLSPKSRSKNKTKKLDTLPR
jgi:hypothetical protein